jgi:hypothetical protein
MGYGATHSWLHHPFPRRRRARGQFQVDLLRAAILEYRPYRAFSANQSSTVLFQLFAGADVPYGESVVSPIGALTPSLRTVWSVGVRMTFDWRYYWQ